jgi:hypothetical protein
MDILGTTEKKSVTLFVVKFIELTKIVQVNGKYIIGAMDTKITKA